MSQSWSSSVGFIASSVGAALGLGSLWMFPYMVHQYGGAFFVLGFILASFAVGLPALYGEFSIGQQLRMPMYRSLVSLLGSTNGKIFSFFLYTTLFFTLSFYTIATSWAFYVCAQSILALFQKGSLFLHQQDLLEPLMSSPKTSFVILLLTWFSLIVVHSMPVDKGLERIAKLFIFILASILCYLALASMHTEAMRHALSFIFIPKWEHWDLHQVSIAIGQACFGLAVGAGCMITYATYNHSSSEKLWKYACLITLSCVALCVLVLIAIFPYMFMTQEPIVAGPSFVFKVLPIAFRLVPYGLVFSSFYFTALFLAALTSSFSQMEPFVQYLESMGWQRFTASLFIALTAGSVSCIINASLLFPACFSCNLFDLTIVGITKFALPLGVVFFSLMNGWCKPLKHSKGLRYYYRFVLPTFIIAINILS